MKTSAESQAVDESASDDSSRRSWRQRFKRLALLLTLVAALPSLIGLTGQTSRVIGLVSPELGRATRIGAATLHFWQPLELRDVEIEDPTTTSDQTTGLLKVALVRSREPFWKIVLSGARGVHFEVDDVRVNLMVRDGRTNLEDALDKFGWAKEPSDGGKPHPVSVTARNVQVAIREADLMSDTAVVVGPASVSFSTLNQQTFPEVRLHTTVRAFADSMTENQPPLQPIRTEVAARVDAVHSDVPMLPFTQAEVDQLRHPTEAKFEVEVFAEHQAGTGQRCHLLVQGLDLGLLQPIIHRFAPGCQLNGVAGIQMDGILPTRDVAGIAGRFLVHAKDVRGRAANWSADEQLQIPSLTADGALALADDGVLIQRMTVESDLLSVSGDGEVRREHRQPIDQIRKEAAARPPSLQQVVDEASALTNGRVQIKARLDVAKLCSMLPRTLKLSRDVRIQQGQILASCRIHSDSPPSNDGPPALKWRLAVQPSEFQASGTQGTIRVQPETRLDLAGEFDAYQPVLKQARLTGSLGDVHIRHAAAEWQVAGTFTPRRFWQEFGSLIDLPAPEVHSIQLDGRAKFHPDRLQIPQLQLVADDVQVDADSLSFWFDRPALESLHGQIRSSGSTTAMAVLLRPWVRVPADLIGGTYDISLSAQRGKQFDIRAAMAVPSSPHLPRSTSAKLHAHLERSAESDDYQIQEGSLSVPGLTADLSGTLNSAAGAVSVDLQTACHYDLAALQNHFLPAVRETLFLSGRGSTTVQIHGNPLVLAVDETGREPLAVTGTVHWDDGQMAGLTLGPGEVDLRLQNGSLRTSRIDCSLGQGRLTGMAQWNLAAEEIQLASGSRLDNVELTPELCAGWFRYVSPLLARSTSASGKVSLRADQFVWNLAHTEASQAAVELKIDHGTMNPSDTVQPILQALTVLTKERLSDTSIRLPAQTVRLQLQNGVVSHDQFQMTVSDYPLMTQGSVHLSGPVQLTLHLPTRRDAVPGTGEMIEVPVSGTTGQPRIDVRALLQNAGQQQIRERLNEELDRGLNQLFEKLR